MSSPCKGNLFFLSFKISSKKLKLAKDDLCSKKEISSFVLFSEMRTCYFILSDCLQSFTDLEELEESELYMCSTCKMKQRSTKKFWIRRLPNVIFFSLTVTCILEGLAYLN